MLYLSSTSNHNLYVVNPQTHGLCYIFLLHQTTTSSYKLRLILCCVISFFYIKPQLQQHTSEIFRVVLYLSSTSNHNRYIEQIAAHFVVLYLSSTSNHNPEARKASLIRLCYIFLLHQTTTSRLMRDYNALLCYIFLLHQTTTGFLTQILLASCVISFFYIKPQQWPQTLAQLFVVLYLSSTSNHNIVA